MTDLSSRIRHALLADPDEAIGSRLSADTIAAAVERIVAVVKPAPAPSPVYGPADVSCSWCGDGGGSDCDGRCGRKPWSITPRPPAPAPSRDDVLEEAATVAHEMYLAWVARSHQDHETRLVAEMLGKCKAAIRALQPGSPAQPKPSPERNLTQGLIFDLETEAIEAVPYTRDLLLKAARALRARSLDPADKDAQ